MTTMTDTLDFAMVKASSGMNTTCHREFPSVGSASPVPVRAFSERGPVQVLPTAAAGSQISTQLLKFDASSNFPSHRPRFFPSLGNGAGGPFFYGSGRFHTMRETLT